MAMTGKEKEHLREASQADAATRRQLSGGKFIVPLNHGQNRTTRG